ncbi:hypothetical protein [Pseudaquabacterium terrae]|uniref:hypothetical protein n=1 Tax=Pseudaquabacterium terrae TaxID=2732868 RepID=UPI0031B5813A
MLTNNAGVGALGAFSAVACPADVAEVVRQAVNDTSERLHFPAGADAVALAQAG